MKNTLHKNEDQQKKDLENIMQEFSATQNFIAKDYAYYYDEIPKELKDSLTHEQAEAVKRILQRATKTPTKKIIDFRTSFWFFKKLYIVVVIGEKKTNAFLGNSYKDKASIIRVALKSLVYMTLFILLAVAIFFILYIIKSLLGINLMPHKHLIDLF